MILTQLFYVHPGQEAVFDAFEATVIPLLAHHGGELLLRLRPQGPSVVSASIEVPYEVHLVRFPSDAALDAYTDDPVRQAALPQRAASFRSVLVVKGAEV